jgi:hypothetical protein
MDRLHGEQVVTMSHIDELGQYIEESHGVSLDETGRRERIDITKTALREVIREWLDERTKAVGKWSIRGIGLAAFAALIYFILTHSGWTRS